MEVRITDSGSSATLSPWGSGESCLSKEQRETPLTVGKWHRLGTGSGYRGRIRSNFIINEVLEYRHEPLFSRLVFGIPGTLIGLLWWCFVLFKALLGFTWVFVLRHYERIFSCRIGQPDW